jgi:hypothetical protein
MVSRDLRCGGRTVETYFQKGDRSFRKMESVLLKVPGSMERGYFSSSDWGHHILLGRGTPSNQSHNFRAGYQSPNHADTRAGRSTLETSYDEWLELPHRRLSHPDTIEQGSAACAQCISVSRRNTQGLRFAVSQTGRMCLVPPGAAVGDKIMISEHLVPPYLINYIII